MVRKKIFDVTPPQKEKEEIIISAGSAKEIISPIRKNNAIIYFCAVLILLLALVSSYFFIPPKAEVELWPKKENIQETTTVVVSAVRKGDNFVPGEILKIEKVVSRSFEVQGRQLKATKAYGVIRVYNNYSVAPQPLLANTRFVSDSGKLFRTPKGVVIPGGHYEGGKLAAGFIDIEVMADQPGAEYNIDASTFSIPGFAGTPKYTAFYAKSFEPMSGGAKEEVSCLTQEDLDKAQEFLNKSALTEGETALRDSMPSEGYILIDKAISVSVKTADFKTSAELGQEADSFSAQVKVLAKALVFREQALKNFSSNYIQKNFTPEEKLIENFLQIEYSPEKVDLEKGEIILKITVSAKSHSSPEETLVKEMIKNKSIREVESVLKDIPQIDRARVEFWPFWVNLAPDDFNKIKVVLHLD